MNKKKQILIIDDETDVRDGASLWLNAGGYATQSAEDGEAGVESAIANRPDAILLDVNMPKMDGLQTLAKLRASPSTHDVPVVMLSASLRDEKRALDAGAKFFIHKPHEGKELVAITRAAMQTTDSGGRRPSRQAFAT